MPPVVVTHANSMQANIRPRTAERNILVNEFPRVTSGEILAHQTPPNQRTERVRMALEDNPTQ
jgi:hypothetical protein